ncbi:F11 receptor, tandem duplicate 1 [Aplochiton taeniatus]
MFGSGLVSVCVFLCATGVGAFTVTTSNANVRVKENEGCDLTCSYSGDFQPKPRLEWKFKDLKGSQVYVIFDNKPTESYANRITFYDNNVRFSKVTRQDSGIYSCEVSGNNNFKEVLVTLTVLVPPSVPICRVPTSATTGRDVKLSCHDMDGSPPPTYKWYKDGTLLPENPRQFPAFKNYTYKMNQGTGDLVFPASSKMDTGSYYCESVNDAGPAQRCAAVRMEVVDVNTGGIVAGVIVALLAVALLAFGLWYANKKGYLPSKFSFMFFLFTNFIVYY